jgi:hypothetical protein
MALKQAYVAHGWFKVALPKGFPADTIWNLAKPAYDSGCACHRWFRASRA